MGWQAFENMHLLYITTGCFTHPEKLLNSTLLCTLIRFDPIAELCVVDILLACCLRMAPCAAFEPGSTQVTHWIDPSWCLGGRGAIWDPGALVKSYMAQMARAGGTNNYNDYVDETQPLGQQARSGIAAGSDSARASSKALPSMKPLSSGATGTLTPAQQRELERESAYEASTGSAAASLPGVASTASGNSKASQSSWGAIAGHSDGSAAQTGASALGIKPDFGDELPQSSAAKQQSMSDGEREADMEDYDPRAFATGSTDFIKRAADDYPADPTGQAQAWNPRTSKANTGNRVQPSMGGEEEFGEEVEERGRRDFIANRDPTDPNSVVSAQQGRGGHLQAGHQHNTGVNAAGSGMKVSSFAEWWSRLCMFHQIISYHLCYILSHIHFVQPLLCFLPFCFIICGENALTPWSEAGTGLGLCHLPCSGAPSALVGWPIGQMFVAMHSVMCSLMHFPFNQSLIIHYSPS